MRLDTNKVEKFELFELSDCVRGFYAYKIHRSNHLKYSRFCYSLLYVLVLFALLFEVSMHWY